MPKSRKTRASSTAGKMKGENCHRSEMKNKYSKDTKWYKKDVANYVVACEHINKEKGNQKSGWIEELKRQ